jgi:hypothetical protein
LEGRLRTMMASASPLPAWVHKRDGRLVPFEADRICQSLFGATETLGRPDAFLARELTDSVLHFLRVETAGGITLATSQIAEITAKVVRELGHPALARAFAESGNLKAERRQLQAPAQVQVSFARTDPPRAVVARCLQQYSLEAVFSRDLASAQQAGLLTLACLDTPLAMAAYVVRPPGLEGGPELIEVLEEARELAGGYVVVDSPEHILCDRGGEADPAGFAQRLRHGLRLTDLKAVVHLHCSVPPVWAEAGADAPLFASRRPLPNPGQLEATAEALLRAFLGTADGAGRVRVEWHMNGRDFGPTGISADMPVLRRCVKEFISHPELGFRFDRPRQSLALGPGLDRCHPAVLLAVGLHLPRLAEIMGPARTPDVFLRKLSSLARLALSAAAQKRAFLRRHCAQEKGSAAAIGRGFLLDRARLVVVPMGLEAAVQKLTGHNPAEDPASLEVARQAIQHLRSVLEKEGEAAGLDVCLDGPDDILGEWEEMGLDGGNEYAICKEMEMSAFEWCATARRHLRAAGVLHQQAGGGTVVLALPPEAAARVDALADLLQYSWQQTAVAGLRLTRVAAARQQTFPGLL